MNENEFMGLLIGCIATLLGIGGAIIAIIVKPIVNLNTSITKLNASIDNLNKDANNLEERVTKHGKEIDENTKHLIVHDEEIKHIKEKMK